MNAPYYSLGLLVTASVFAQTDAALKPAAYQSGVAQENLIKETQVLSAELSVLVEQLERNGFSGRSVAEVQALATTLEQLGGAEMVAIAQKLRATAQGHAGATTSESLASTYTAQQEVEGRLRAIARQLALRQMRESLIQQLQQLIVRQILTQRDTAALQPQSAPNQLRVNLSDQTSIGQDLSGIFSAGDSIVAKLNEEAGAHATSAPGAASFTERMNGKQLVAIADETVAVLQKKDFAEATKGQRAIVKELHRILQSIVSSQPATERLTAALGAVRDLQAQQAVLAAQLGTNPTQAANGQATLAAQALALQTQVAASSPSSASAVNQAAQSMNAAAQAAASPSTAGQAQAQAANAASALASAAASIETQLNATAQTASTLSNAAQAATAAAQAAQAQTTPAASDSPASAAQAHAAQATQSAQAAQASAAQASAVAQGSPAAAAAQAAAHSAQTAAAAAQAAASQASNASSPAAAQAAANAAQTAATQASLASAQAATQAAAAASQGNSLAQAATAQAAQALATASTAAAQGRTSAAATQAQAASQALANAAQALGVAPPSSGASRTDATQLSSAQSSGAPSDPSANGGQGSDGSLDENARADGGEIGFGNASGNGPVSILGTLTPEQREAMATLQNERPPADYARWNAQYWRNLTRAADSSP